MTYLRKPLIAALILALCVLFLAPVLPVTAAHPGIAYAADPDEFNIDKPPVTTTADPDEFTVDRHTGVETPDTNAEYERTGELEGRWRVFADWFMCILYYFGVKEAAKF